MSQMTPEPYLQAAPTGQGEPPTTYWVPPPPPPPPAPPAPPHRGDPHVGRWILISVLVAVIAAGGSGIGVGWSIANVIRHQPAVQSPIAIASPTTGPINGSAGANAIAAKVDPAIVDINTVVGSSQAAGTGMILTSGGEVLTNNHVVNGSSSIRVAIAAHSGTYTAHVIGVAPHADVALIQIEGVSNLPTITITSSSTLKIGDSIVALGNALGLGGTPTVSTGSVIALNQSITASEGSGKSEQLAGMIQSDAPISPGDSGGPIVNSAGQVVGMITAGDVQGFRSQTSTVNYAIPSDTLLSYANKINAGVASSDIIYGQVGLMGVSVQDLSADITAQLGFNVSSGAYVRDVSPGSPAESGGITPGSVITSVGGTKVTSSATLGTAIQAHKPGEQISVTWVDQHGTHTATVTLAGVNP